MQNLHIAAPGLAHAMLALACCLGMAGACAHAAPAAPAASAPPAASAAPATPDVAKGPQAGDPARWYVEDASAAAQLRTLQKEIGAALQEAKAECKRGPAAARASCDKDAAAIYQKDMANASAQRAAAHPQ